MARPEDPQNPLLPAPPEPRTAADINRDAARAQYERLVQAPLLQRQEERRIEWENGPHARTVGAGDANREIYENGEHAKDVRWNELDRKEWQDGPHADYLQKVARDREIDKNNARIAAEAAQPYHSYSGSLNPIQNGINFTHLFTSYDEAAAKIIKRHPEISPTVIHAVAGAYKHEAVAYEMDRRRAANERTRSGMRPNPGDLRNEVRGIDEMHVRHIGENIFRQHGEQGAKALVAFEKEVRPPSIFDGILKNVYDDGIKWGGVAGAVIGGLMGWVMAGSASGLLAIGGIILATIAGSWAGSEATSYFGKMLNKPSAPAKAPTHATGKAPEKTEQQTDTQQEITEEVAAKATEAAKPAPPAQTPAAASQSPVDVGNQDQLTPGATPKPVAPAPETKHTRPLRF